MNKILITGVTGQLGREVQDLLVNQDVVGMGRQQIELAQTEEIARTIREIRPDSIVNAAAYTAVDRAESEPELANAINAIAPTIIARTAREIGAFLIHLSTDYVFDGQKNTPYLETDLPNPISVYGRSKLAGEEGIRQTGASHIILRTAWVYGTHGKGNFVKTMLQLGKEREEVRVVADRLGTPTWTGDLAETIARLIAREELIRNGNADTYHFTNSGVASWYDFAVAIFEESKQLGFPLKVRQVVPISSQQYPTIAPRPAYSVLSCQKISAVLETHPPHWRTSLRQMLDRLYLQSKI